MLKRFLFHWLAIVVALWATSKLLGGVAFVDWKALAIASVVLALVNALVRPVLFVLTLPITILTLGLFYLVVNGAAFGLAAWLTPGFTVATRGTAVLGALLVGVVSWVVGILLSPLKGGK